MSYPCARCNFVAEDDESAEDHARETSHLRCIVCQRSSLTAHERQTCPRCIGAVRVALAEILDGYALLEPVGTNRLTLLADGTMQRMPRADELERNIHDEWPTDPLPVVAAFASWEDMIREEYGDGKGAVPATLSATVDYLMSNLDSRHNLAQTFHAFDDFAVSIRHHRAAVHHAAFLADDPVEADPECFDCGGPLLRTYRPPVAPVGEGRKGMPGEGLADEWTCGWCRREYTQTSYFLALRAKSSQWVPVPLAAETTQRSIWTVRSWARRGLVTAACRVLDRAVLVWWPDVSDRAFRQVDESKEAS